MNIPERPSKVFRGNAPSPSGSKRRAPMPRKQTAHMSMPIRPNSAGNQHGVEPIEQETAEPEAIEPEAAAEPETVATH